MQARLSLDLVTLKDDVPREVPVEDLGVRDPEPNILLGKKKKKNKINNNTNNKFK